MTVATPAEARASETRPEPTVVLLSWDGTRWDYPERTSLPALERMAREGARARRLVPVFPTSTFPNHVSLATGAPVSVHGVVGNVFDDPELGHFDKTDDARFLRAEPLWAAAERQGVTSAVFFWVGSATDWNGVGPRYRVVPFDGTLPEEKKVDQILKWLDLPDGERPRLILSWWHGADAVGHRHGPDDERIQEQLRDQDRQLGRLLAGLDARNVWPHTTLLLVSDHGMTEVARSLDVVPLLADQNIEARVINGAGYAYVTLEDTSELVRALAFLDALDGVSAHRSDRRPDPLEAAFPDRSGHITLVADPPLALFRPRNAAAGVYQSVRSLFGGRRTSAGGFGMHGYLPEHPDMHAVFYALGRGIPPGSRPESVSTLDVAPTVAELLGIAPPRDAVGSPVRFSAGP